MMCFFLSSCVTTSRQQMRYYPAYSIVKPNNFYSDVVNTYWDEYTREFQRKTRDKAREKARKDADDFFKGLSK